MIKKSAKYSPELSIGKKYRRMAASQMPVRGSLKRDSQELYSKYQRIFDQESEDIDNLIKSLEKM